MLLRTSLISFVLLNFVIIITAQRPLQIDNIKLGSSSRSNSLGLLADGKIFRNASKTTSSRMRLPNTVVPSLYTLRMIPIVEEGTGSPFGPQWTIPGTVDINVECKVQSAVITMHSKNIDINFAATQVLSGPDSLEIVSQEYITDGDFFVITLRNPLVVGQTYIIQLTFVSQISEELNGFYRSSYFDEESQSTIWLGTTQLESSHARQVFPCFDEPSLKAIFDVTIGRLQKYSVLFDTELVSTIAVDGHPEWVWDKFAPTVIMPTYLLAVIVSFFTYTEASTNHSVGITLRTYAPKHNIDRNGGSFSADMADQLLAFFQEYYEQPYPLSKMDSAAVPDFSFGAMENWGLNIYRESVLLYFPDESTESERFNTIDYMSHELGHQFFGNLVTCDFWTHIWLNEGLSTYIEAMTEQEVCPEFDSWDRFNNDATQYAMSFDARSDVSHSVKIDEDLYWTKDPMDWFNAIVYEKGAALIHMLNSILGEATLKKGLRKYLEARKYATAVQDQLFENLNIAALEDNVILPEGLTIKNIMDSWTLQPHFPLLTVSRASATRIFVSQARFTNNQMSPVDSSSQWDPRYLWYVPVSLATEDNPDFSPAPEFWIDKNVILTSVVVEDTSKWLVLNAGASGYYRVLYDGQLTRLLREQLERNHSVIASPATRSQILDDYFNCAWQRHINIQTALQMTDYMGKETNFAVWSTVFTNLRRALNLLQDDSLQKYLLPKVESALELVGGATNEDPGKGMPTLRHAQLLDWSCSLDGQQCQALSSEVFEQWKANPSTYPVRVDIRSVLYCAIVAHGGEEQFEFMKLRYQDSQNTNKQRGLLLNSLACTRDISTINAILEGLLDDNFYIAKEQRGTLLQRLGMNRFSRNTVLSFIASRLEDINSYFGNINGAVSSISTMSTYMSTVDDLEKIEKIKNDYPELIGTKLNGAISTINGNFDWMNNFSEDMMGHFNSR